MGTSAYKNKAGKRVPSVTTLIKNLGWSTDALLAWYAREFSEGRDPRDLSSQACLTGTIVHEMIEHHIFGQDDYTPPEGATGSDLIQAGECLCQYIQWETENNVTYLESELAMVSETLQVGGCCDAIAIVNGVCTLVDFKTSKSLYDTYAVQLAGYKYMVEELTDYKIDQCLVVKIDKNGLGITPYYIPNDIIEIGYDVFDMCIKLHKAKSDLGKFVRKACKNELQDSEER